MVQSLQDDTIVTLAEAFVREGPLERLFVAGKYLYCKPGMRRAQVLREIASYSEFVAYQDLYESGWMTKDSVAPSQFLEALDIELKEMKK